MLIKPSNPKQPDLYQQMKQISDLHTNIPGTQKLSRLQQEEDPVTQFSTSVENNKSQEILAQYAKQKLIDVYVYVYKHQPLDIQ